MKNTSKFQNVVIVTIVGWLVLFVFLPNLMIIGTSFLTRDDASFVKMVFTLDNYTRLLDPLYFEVLWHSPQLLPHLQFQISPSTDLFPKYA